MAIFALAIVLFAVGLLALIIGRSFFYVPPKELKRRAAQGDPTARKLYRAAAYDADLSLVLWVIVTLCSAGGFVLFARVAPPVLGFVAIALGLLVTYVWLPHRRPGRLGIRLALFAAPFLVRVMRVIHPVARHITRVDERRAAAPHTGVFDHKDMEWLLERQLRQEDNLISEQDITRMRRALQFGGYRVRDVAVPRERVLAVDADGTASPVLLDELYQSGHAFFPVYEGKPADIIGLLPLDNVADGRRDALVRDYCSPHLAYVQEDDSLEQALQALAETHQHLLVVVNQRGAYVGIVSLGDITRQLLGYTGPSGANHEDRAVVAGRHHASAEVSQKPPEVVE